MNKNKHQFNNLYEGLAEEKKEAIEISENNEKRLVDDFLRNRFEKKREPQVREGISLPIADVKFVKSLREKIVRQEPSLMPNKSQLYRLGIRQLRDKTDKEILSLYKELLTEIEE